LFVISKMFFAGMFCLPYYSNYNNLQGKSVLMGIKNISPGADIQ